MRDMSPPPWLRIAGFVAMASALWLATSWLSPAADRLASLTLESRAKALFEGDDALDPAGPYRALERGAWAPPCDAAAAAIVKRVTLDPSATAGLTLDCRVSADTVSLALRVATDAPATTRTLERAAELPTGTSILPPLFGILLALVFRKVLLALFSAVLLGALLVEDGAVLPALERTATTYLVDNLASSSNLYLLGFTVALVGMIHVSIRMGGMQGVVDKLSRIARGRRSAQVAAGAVGLTIFFDDYANTVVTGSSVRPLTDAHRVSREKLAYIVDSSAAPLAGLAVISTWIGVEVGFFNDQMEHLTTVASSGYDFFFQILPYRFYCLFAVALVYVVALSGRDFGPMLAAERRAYKEGLVRRRDSMGSASGEDATRRRDTVAKPGLAPRWFNGVIPIATVVLGTFGASVVTGTAALDAANPHWADALGFFGRLREAFVASSANSTTILFWAAIAGAGAAFLLAFAQRLLTLREAAAAFFDGMRMVAPVIAILVLAIGLRVVTDDLHTPLYLVALIGDVPLWVLPITIFGLASFIAFSTGTSWGTMGILMPVAIPLVANLTAGDPSAPLLLLLSGSAVLDGAIFGDHCSLISDTTIMSSLSSGCDHIDHVRTQLPYALLAMFTAGIVGYGLMAWSDAAVPVVAVYALGVGVMWGWLRLRGKDAAA